MKYTLEIYKKQFLKDKILSHDIKFNFVEKTDNDSNNGESAGKKTSSVVNTKSQPVMSSQKNKTKRRKRKKK